VVQRPLHLGLFQFAVLSGLRAEQLTRGCTPRVDGVHKRTIIAQLEVAAGLVTQALGPTADAVKSVAPVDPLLEVLQVTT
jgi:hypothetical protein